MKILLKICLILCLSVIVSCATEQPRPKPEVCIYYKAINKMFCHDSKIQKNRRIDGDKYVCLAPDDFKDSMYFLKGLYQETKNEKRSSK